MDFATSITKSKIWADNDCKIISLLQGTDITVHKPHLSYSYLPVLTLHLFKSWKLFCTTNLGDFTFHLFRDRNIALLSNLFGTVHLRNIKLIVDHEDIVSFLVYLTKYLLQKKLCNL